MSFDWDEWKKLHGCTRQRLSLFGRPHAVNDERVVKYEYPPEYLKKLSKGPSLKRLDSDEKSDDHKKREIGIVKLSPEKQEILNSLPDAQNYVQEATKFITKCNRKLDLIHKTTTEMHEELYQMISMDNNRN